MSQGAGDSDSRTRLLRCTGSALYRELSRGADAHGRLTDFARRSVNQLVHAAQGASSDEIELPKIEDLLPTDEIGDALVALAFIKAVEECKSSRETEGSRRSADGFMGFVPSALAGLGIGLGLPSVVDTDIGHAGTLLSTGSALLLGRQVVTEATEKRMEIAEDTENASGGKRRFPRVRKFLRGMGRVSGQIAVGAMSSGVGVALVEGVEQLSRSFG